VTLSEIAKALTRDNQIVLVYAFNATGKTRLCVEYKNETKLPDGSHVGVYYNAYSEDLFVWDNDEENNGANIRITLISSSLSRFHASLTESLVREKLRPYKPKYDFEFSIHEDSEKGVSSISFYIPSADPQALRAPIKISRGEERIFVWCFFLALFEVEGWADEKDSHFFIDDPVSSLDDHNIFVTAATLLDLIDSYHQRRRIIIATHHIGLFCILKDRLLRGEKSGKYKPLTSTYILRSNNGALSLERDGKEVMLYHLQLLKVLMKARQSNGLRAYHFALLRQVLENVASFLGTSQFAYVLHRIGIHDKNDIADIVNTLSHKRIYYYESDLLQDETRASLEDVLDKLQESYRFKLQLGKS
jgi:hypothetical protein